MSSQVAQNSTQSNKKKPVSSNMYTLDTFHPTSSNISIVNFKANAVSKLGESGVFKHNGDYFSVILKDLQTPFGAKLVEIANQNSSSANQKPKYALTFSVPEDSSLHIMFDELDEAVYSYLDIPNPITDRIVGKNNKGVRKSRQAFESLYKSILKDGKEVEGTKYDRTFTASITPEGVFTTEFYDKGSNLLSVTYDSENRNDPTYLSNVCPKGSKCNILMSPQFWKSGDNFGIKWQLRQVKVFVPEVNIVKGQCVLDDDDEQSNQQNQNDYEDPNFDDTGVEE